MNKRLARLEDRQKELTARIDELLERTNSDGDLCTADEEAYHTALGEKSAITDAILNEHENKRYVTDNLPTNALETFGDSLRQPIGGGTATGTEPVNGGGQIGATYAKLFGQANDTGGWRDYNEYLSQIQSGLADPRLNALTEGVGSDGGFMVPTAFAAERLDTMIEESIVLPRARVFPMTTDEKRIAGFDASTATSTALYGGITAAWLGEGSTITEANPVVRQVILKVKKLALLCAASNELASDGMDLDSQLSGAMASASSWFCDYAFLQGTGVGQPLGCLNDPAVISVAAEGAQDADSIVVENLIKMQARIHPACFGNSIWLANPNTIPELMQLSYSIGVSGQHVPILRENDGGMSLLTRKVIFSEKMPTLGDAGDIALVDLSQYAVGLRKEVSIEKSGHVHFATDRTAWRAITRLDGQGLWDSVYTPANGSTLSWVVTLAERA